LPGELFAGASGELCFFMRFEILEFIAWSYSKLPVSIEAFKISASIDSTSFY